MNPAATDRPAAGLFSEVVGQPRAVQALQAAARDPVHAYLFCGSEGSGTRAAARAFAAALLCPDGGCGECPTCQRALDGTHPDLVTVERTGAALGVDEARRLVGLAQRRPFEASRQVLVVTDVHLALRSAPALLKTIEEPPVSTVFVLLADTVPPELVTVASRCVTVDFPPVPTRLVADWLERRGLPGARAALVAEGAAGDLDRARLLAEDPGFADRLDLWRSVPAVLDGQGATAGRLARQLLGAADTALQPLKAHHAAELDAMAAEAKEFGERGVPGRKDVAERQHREERRWRTDELRIGFGILARAYRDRLAVQVATVIPTAGAAGRSYESAIDMITEAAESLQRNPNETLLLESLLVRLGSVAA